MKIESKVKLSKNDIPVKSDDNPIYSHQVTIPKPNLNYDEISRIDESDIVSISEWIED